MEEQDKPRFQNEKRMWIEMQKEIAKELNLPMPDESDLLFGCGFNGSGELDYRQNGM